jgi:hypothetical protein
MHVYCNSKISYDSLPVLQLPCNNNAQVALITADVGVFAGRKRHKAGTAANTSSAGDNTSCDC